MRAVATWEGRYRSRLADGRDHEVVVDLPPFEGGTDAGTSSLELLVLSFAGCISTIFLLVAERRRLQVESLRVELEAERPKGARTITAVRGDVWIVSPSAAEDVATAVRLTVRTCPVGTLLDQAGVRVSVEPHVSAREAEPLAAPAV